MSGSYAYVADWDGGLRVIDVSNPASPHEAGFYGMPGGPSDVAVSGVYAYVADGVSGLRVIDVSNPTSPREVGFYYTAAGGTPYAVALSGSYAYVADFCGGLVILRYTGGGAGAKPWTLMYYLALDNNLDENLNYYYHLLRQASENRNVNIVAFVDSRELPAKYLAFWPGGGANYPKGEVSTGDPATLQDFVTWAKQNYPAQHYALIIDDHGHGHTGVAWDDHTPGMELDCNLSRCLRLTELRQALTAAGKVDVLYMEACLMATIEAAWQLRDLTDYYVASEQIAWGPSHLDWPVVGDGGAIPAISATTTPEQFAVARAQAYYFSFRDRMPGTISVARMAALPTLKDKTSALAALLKTQMGILHETIKEIKRDVQYFDGNGNMKIETNDELVDLYHFAQLVKERVSDTNIREAASALLSAVDSYIVRPANSYELYWRSGQEFEYEAKKYTWQLGNAHGVSIFFPDYSRSFYKDNWLDFAAGTEWDINNVQSLASLAQAGETIAWGPMLVEYVRYTKPTHPDDPNPPALVEVLTAPRYVYLPIIRK